MYSLRTFCQNPEELKETILKCKAMGYQNVQFSGVAQMDAEVWAKISEETGMEIVCTHNPFDRIVNETDALIAEHKIFGCPVIGIGSMPGEFRNTRENLDKFFAVMEEPVRKIEAAGLRFAYHNHAFEFDKFTDAEGCPMEALIEEKPNWLMLLDTGWVQVAGKSAVEYIERIGGERLQCIHFKEFNGITQPASDAICACGEGFSDFPAIVAACKKVGVKNVLVEQDNAPMKEDPFGEMQKSFNHLRPLFNL